MSALLWLLTAVSAPVIGAEVIGWCGPAQRFLVRRAAAKLPPNHRDRYVEEWMAELGELPDGPFTRFAFVASLLIRRRRLVAELGTRAQKASKVQEYAARGIKLRLLRTMPHDVERVWDAGRVLIAERSDGERQAWRLEGRWLTPVDIPAEDVEHIIRRLPHQIPDLDADDR